MRSFSPLFFCVYLLALLRLAGGDFAVVQVYAWGEMIVTRSLKVGITEAISTTFDGQHPCSLCDTVRDASAQERLNTEFPAKAPAPDQDKSPLVSKLLAPDCPLFSSFSASAPQTGLLAFAGTCARLEGKLPEDPATPPPRA